MISPKKYTLTAMSIGANPSTSLFDKLIEAKLQPFDSLEEAIRFAFMMKPLFMVHIIQNAMPLMLKIESQEGMVALANIEIKNPAIAEFDFDLIWQKPLSPSEWKGYEQAIKFNQSKADAIVYDDMGAAEQVNATYQVKIAETVLASKSFAEPIEQTLRLVFKIENESGGMANKVRHLEEGLGL